MKDSSVKAGAALMNPISTPEMHLQTSGKKHEVETEDTGKKLLNFLASADVFPSFLSPPFLATGS